MTGEEAVVHRVEDGEHYLLEAGEAEALVTARDLGGVGELVAVDTGREETVGVPLHRSEHL
ncbi:hypothetical protein [Streptomyces sp. NPDC088554]|uniref:hypothetical protein n=1 Tax=Streptomyces sp. NPDC088554 TaxID=3365865 RepID=UPI00381E77FF